MYDTFPLYLFSFTLFWVWDLFLFLNFHKTEENKRKEAIIKALTEHIGVCGKFKERFGENEEIDLTERQTTRN